MKSLSEGSECAIPCNNSAQLQRKSHLDGGAEELQKERTEERCVSIAPRSDPLGHGRNGLSVVRGLKVLTGPTTESMKGALRGAAGLAVRRGLRLAQRIPREPE